MIIRHAKESDMKSVYSMELAAFPPAGAASPDAYPYRLKHFPECFFIAEAEGTAVAFLAGRPVTGTGIRDEMYHNEPYPQGSSFALLSVATSPSFQGQGIAEALIKEGLSYARTAGFETMILACKEENLGFYKRFGFCEEGISESSHGEAVWYDMIIKF